MRNEEVKVEAETPLGRLKVAAKEKGPVFGMILLLFLIFGRWVTEARYVATLLVFVAVVIFTFLRQMESITPS
jgi:hypothetical protein